MDIHKDTIEFLKNRIRSEHPEWTEKEVEMQAFSVSYGVTLTLRPNFTPEQIREMRGWESQTNFACRAYAGAAQVCRWERGASVPSMESEVNIVDAVLSSR